MRRYIVRVKSLERPSWQSLTVLCFIFILMVSFIFYEAFKMTIPWGRDPGQFPGQLGFARLLPPASAISAAAVRFWLKLLWWLHILVIMAFGVFIMYSKHLHLLAGPLNLLFKNLGVKAEIPLVNLEEQEKFGTPQLTDLTARTCSTSSPAPSAGAATMSARPSSRARPCRPRPCWTS